MLWLLPIAFTLTETAALSCNGDSEQLECNCWEEGGKSCLSLLSAPTKFLALDFQRFESLRGGVRRGGGERTRLWEPRMREEILRWVRQECGAGLPDCPSTLRGGSLGVGRVFIVRSNCSGDVESTAACRIVLGVLHDSRAEPPLSPEIFLPYHVLAQTLQSRRDLLAHLLNSHSSLLAWTPLTLPKDEPNPPREDVFHFLRSNLGTGRKEEEEENGMEEQYSTTEEGKRWKDPIYVFPFMDLSTFLIFLFSMLYICVVWAVACYYCRREKRRRGGRLVAVSEEEADEAEIQAFTIPNPKHEEHDLGSLYENA